jgi:hypothetical protein
LTVRVDGRSYLTAEGAARLLGVPVATVRRLVCLPVGRDGVGLRPVQASSARRFLFTRESVLRFGNGESMPWWKWWKREQRRKERRERLKG